MLHYMIIRQKYFLSSCLFNAYISNKYLRLSLYELNFLNILIFWTSRENDMLQNDEYKRPELTFQLLVIFKYVLLFYCIAILLTKKYSSKCI